mgnify:CR=1 FL=1
MIFWTIQQIILSITIIACAHHIYIYFKNNLTVPKTKDLVKKPSTKTASAKKATPKKTTPKKAARPKKKTTIKNQMSKKVVLAK